MQPPVLRSRSASPTTDRHSLLTRQSQATVLGTSWVTGPWCLKAARGWAEPCGGTQLPRE